MAEIDGADHFDLIDPSHAAWSAVLEVLDGIDPANSRTTLG